jgi:hypothetical protein
LAVLAAAWLLHGQEPPEAITPKETAQLFNGRDLTGLYTWCKKTQREDPDKVFSVVDGMIRASGRDNGYIATDKAYRDYHLVVEYKWGQRPADAKYVRNAGILLHGTGPDGAAGGAWMSSIECQLAQGCVGDIVVIRGKNEKGELAPYTITAQTELGPDKRLRWKKGGEVRTWPPTKGQLWWNKHEVGFQELIDTRGKDDVESPLGEWTRVECICAGKKITIKVNGHVVNEIYDVSPAAGKILLQSEGFEIFYRTFELRPLGG